MGKALVIQNVNFSDNKLGTVTLLDDIPCTALSLSANTLNLTAVGATATLTAAKTPANTTDAVTWATSNAQVATVENGVVTQTGVGSCTITATCGTKTATCAVTAVNTLTFAYSLGRYNHKADGATEDYVYQESGNSAYAAIHSTVQTDKRLRPTTANKFPILLGNGASTVTITVPNTIRATVWFTNSTLACTYSETQSDSTYAALARLISGDASAFDATVALGPRTLTVPEGADSIAVSLQYPSGTITDEIMAGVTIVAA